MELYRGRRRAGESTNLLNAMEGLPQLGNSVKCGYVELGYYDSRLDDAYDAVSGYVDDGRGLTRPSFFSHAPTRE